MLKPIKIFYIEDGIPQLDDWREAVKIAKADNCVVEIHWMPSIYTGYYHEYVFDDSDPENLDARTPKVYGV